MPGGSSRAGTSRTSRRPSTPRWSCPTGWQAYSNTGEESRTDLEDGRVEIRFAPTMKMSTYLLAFIVGPFEATEPVVVRGTPIRIIVPQGQPSPAPTWRWRTPSSASSTSPTTTASLIPGDKLDHIAIPDFAAGAMENVGLITYRDAYLVIDKARGQPGRAAEQPRRDRPRGRSSVVRQPGDHGAGGREPGSTRPSPASWR